MAVDFWLGERGEGRVTDYDGRLRAGRFLKRIRVAGGAGATHLLVHVDPPLPLGSGREVNQLVLGPRWQGRDLEDLPDVVEGDDPGHLAVVVYELVDEASLAQDVVPAEALRREWYGEIARRPELLPQTQEESFEKSFRLLEKFVARAGHSEVPIEYQEEGVSIGIWVSNLRFEQANLGLREEWAARLERLPGWRWLPGDDFFLLERYAERTGHTRIPEDYFEEGRPLGRWVSELRRSHASGTLAKDWAERLERIPGWVW